MPFVRVIFAILYMEMQNKKFTSLILFGTWKEIKGWLDHRCVEIPGEKLGKGEALKWTEI